MSRIKNRRLRTIGVNGFCVLPDYLERDRLQGVINKIKSQKIHYEIARNYAIGNDDKSLFPRTVGHWKSKHPLTNPVIFNPTQYMKEQEWIDTVISQVNQFISQYNQLLMNAELNLYNEEQKQLLVKEEYDNCMAGDVDPQQPQQPPTLPSTTPTTPPPPQTGINKYLPYIIVAGVAYFIFKPKKKKRK